MCASLVVHTKRDRRVLCSTAAHCSCPTQAAPMHKPTHEAAPMQACKQASAQHAPTMRPCSLRCPVSPRTPGSAGTGNRGLRSVRRDREGVATNRLRWRHLRLRLRLRLWRRWGGPSGLQPHLHCLCTAQCWVVSGGGAPETV